MLVCLDWLEICGIQRVLIGSVGVSGEEEADGIGHQSCFCETRALCPEGEEADG